MSKLQGQSTSCPNSIAQYAAAEALTGNQNSVYEMRNVFELRRNLILQQLAKIDKVTCEIPRGAFYVFPNFNAYLNSSTQTGEKIISSTDLCMYILQETGVVTVSGDSFGAPGYIRISYAVGEEIIVKAISLIKEALLKLIF
jgi:aspartate aminotransferase